VFVPGEVTAIQFYRGAPSGAGFAVHVWDANGDLLGTGHAPGNQAAGWQTVNLDQPVELQPLATYEASYYTSTGGYAADPGFFTTNGASRGSLAAFGASAGEGATAVGNGFFHYGLGGGFADQTFQNTNYWVGPVFQPDASAGIPPTVTSISQTSSPVAGGTLLTITGANFTPDAIGPQVYFGNVRANLTLFSADQIVVFIPAHVAGTVNIRVITSAGQSPISEAGVFTYTS
jgi:hypothetical protein